MDLSKYLVKKKTPVSSSSEESDSEAWKGVITSRWHSFASSPKENVLFWEEEVQS